MNTQELMLKVAEVAPEHHAFFIATTDELKASPFKEEVLLELDGMLKVASPGMGYNMAGRFGNAMAGIGTSVGAGIAYSLAGDMYDAIRRGITKSRNYKDMMNSNPDLGELPAKDVQQAFSALHRFNPEFASDPTVAGSFVRRQATLQDFDPTMLINLVSARKNLTDVKKLPIPGRVPWDKPEEKEQRSLQSSKLRQDIAGDGGLSKDKMKAELEGSRIRNRSESLKLRDEEERRAAEEMRSGGRKPPSARMRKFLNER